MKSISVIKMVCVYFVILVLAVSRVFAQADSTKTEEDKSLLEEGVELGEGINELKKGVKDFQFKIINYEKRIQLLKDSNKVIISEMKDEEDETKKNELQTKIDKNNEEISEYEKKIEAFEHGIEQIENEIEELADKLDDLADELEDSDFFSKEDLGCKKKKCNKFRGHYVGFEFGLNGYLNPEYSMTLDATSKFMELNTNKSWAYSLNFIQHSIPISVGSRYLGFVTGMGVDWNNYRLKQNIDLQEDDNGVISGELSTLTYKKNSLNTVYLKMPLIFEFQIPTGRKDKIFFVGLGAEAAVKINSKTRKVYEKDDDLKKLRIEGDYQLSPFRYGLTARIGYENLQLFGNYSLQPLFEKNQGPELYPFSFGIRIDL